MNAQDVPYSLAANKVAAHEFDLEDLGARMHVLVGIVGSRVMGTRKELGYDKTVTVADYDGQFRDKLLRLNPPQRVRDFLGYHLEYFVGQKGEASGFLEHFKYNVLHMLQQKFSTVPTAMVAKDWYDDAMNDMHKSNARDRRRFLAAAYAYASKAKPSTPLLEAVHHTFIMDELQFSEAKCKRLRSELVQDGLIEGLSGGRFRVLGDGRRSLEGDKAQSGVELSVSGGTNVNIQLQQNSPYASQTSHVGDEIHEARAFAQQLSAALPAIEQQAPPEEFAEIKADLETLKRKLDSSTPPKPMIKVVKEELVKRLMGLPFDALKLLGGQFIG
jgi:hypothetical protein